MLLIGDNQRHQGNCLSRARWHLQHTVTPGVEGLLEITHVGILFGVYARIREQHRKVTVEKSHSVSNHTLFPSSPDASTHSIKNFIVVAGRSSRAFADRVGVSTLGDAMTPGHVTRLSITNPSHAAGSKKRQDDDDTSNVGTGLLVVRTRLVGLPRTRNQPALDEFPLFPARYCRFDLGSDQSDPTL